MDLKKIIVCTTRIQKHNLNVSEIQLQITVEQFNVATYRNIFFEIGCDIWQIQEEMYQ